MLFRSQKGLALFHVKSESFGWKLFQMVRTFMLCSFGRFFPRAVSGTVAVFMIKAVFSSPMPWQMVDGTLFTMGLDGWDLLVVFLMAALVLFVDIAH